MKPSFFCTCFFMILFFSARDLTGQTYRSSVQASHEQNLKTTQLMRKIEKTAVLLHDKKGLIPFRSLEHRSIASVRLDFPEQNTLDSMLNFYAGVQSIDAAKYTDSTDLFRLEDDLKYYNTVIISVTSDGLTNPKYLRFIEDVGKRKDAVIVVFGNGSRLRTISKDYFPVIWTAYKDKTAANVLAQMVFGGIAISGRLPDTFGTRLKEGLGASRPAVRLKFTLPEEVGINADQLKQVDQIAAEGIAGKAAPGMVVLAAKNGKVFYQKAFGHHTYNGGSPEQVNDIFDLASVTKITATTPSVMHLVEKGRLNLDSTIGHYIARARNTPMSKIFVKEVMMHQAGFVPFIPFPKLVGAQDYRRDSSAAFPTKVADHFFIRRDYFDDFMWPTMLYSPIKTRGQYVYSDISMYVMQDIVELLTDTSLDKYAHQQFFAPLGMHNTGYLPRYKFPYERIVPTEDDESFRKTLLRGYVHDEGASLKGGVAGHAGLFSSAADMAAYYQMLLNKGVYGGRRYFSAQTVHTFTKKESKVSRRGYGFDRADPDKSKKYPSVLASPDTYGHTGYTGTCVWVDPQRNLVYIFLSNRVNPTRSPMLSRLEIRGRIQDVFNRAIDQSSQSSASQKK